MEASQQHLARVGVTCRFAGAVKGQGQHGDLLPRGLGIQLVGPGPPGAVQGGGSVWASWSTSCQLLPDPPDRVCATAGLGAGQGVEVGAGDQRGAGALFPLGSGQLEQGPGRFSRGVRGLEPGESGPQAAGGLVSAARALRQAARASG